MNIRNWLIPFVLHPVSAAFKALCRPQNQESTIVLSLFTGLFCFCMVAPNEGMDLYRYLHSLEYIETQTLSDKSDIYIFIIQKFVSTFTKNGHVLMLMFGLICGYFFAKSVRILTIDISSIRLTLLVILFSSIFSLATLCGVRQCTAFYLLFWGAVSFLYTSKWKYLLLACSSLLIHFSFASYCLILLMSIFLKNKPKISLIVFVFSFFISVSGLNSLIESRISLLGSAAEAKTMGYLEVDYIDFQIEYAASLASQAIPIFYSVELIFFIIICLYCVYKTDYLEEKKHIIYSCSFVLLLLSFYNLVATIPHLGIRTQQIVCAIMLYPIIRFLHEIEIRKLYRDLIFYTIISSGFIVFWFEIRKIVEIMPWSMLILPAPLTSLSDVTVFDVLQILGLH